MDVQSLPPELTQPTTQLPPSDSVPTEAINATFGSDCIDLISSALPTTVILSLSDEFFAPASSLLSPRPPISRPGVYIPSGAWYDGWETRRHNPAPFDWVIIRLGVASGIVKGVEIDTAFFDGNHAPVVSVQGCFEVGEGADGKVNGEGYGGWKEVLGKRECGASRRQAWLVGVGDEEDNSGEVGKEEEERVTHVRLCMWPDGGIARFRLWGRAVPVFPADAAEELELSAAVNGGVAVSCSDQHFGGRANLLLPGRGVDMGDGWETARSRGAEHEDWVVVRLAARGTVRRVVIDTAHFRGNYPQGVRVEGADVKEEEKGVLNGADEGRWVEVLGTRKVGPDEEFEFGEGELRNIGAGTAYTHMKMTIVPDGGVKRFRVFGSRV